jgi:hypothetical protein
MPPKSPREPTNFMLERVFTTEFVPANASTKDVNPSAEEKAHRWK